MKIFKRRKFTREKDIKDSDADGILDSEEKKLGTNPHKKDSDSDGLNDYEEVWVYKTDPLNSDTDNDGMSDGDEVKRGRNPLGPGKLKDFFVPHEGNNYRPNSLHPKRLVFYTASSILIKFIVIASLVAMPITAWLTPDVLKEESKKIITLTNEIRKNLGLGMLSENELLNESALNKVQDMLVQQYFAHVGPDKNGLAYWLKEMGYKYKLAGENLAMGFSGAGDVVNAWTKSKTHYANMIDSGFKEIGVAMVSGSYNNRDTTLVAQYFGSPLAREQVAQEKKRLPKPKARKDNVNISREEETKEEIVLSDKEELQKPLLTPRVVSPETGSILGSNNIVINVFVPDAEKLIIYDGASQIAQTKNDSGEDYVNVEVYLKDGYHNLTIENIRGDERVSLDNYTLTIDTKPPYIDSGKTRLFVDEPEGKDEKIIKAKIYLSEDTEEAMLSLGSYEIKLKKNENEPGRWDGQLIIFKEKGEEEIFNPVVLASVTAKDKMGNSATTDIKWDNVIPSKASLVNQYIFIKSHQSKESSYLIELSSIFFKSLIVFLAFSLMLNIFINARKQYADIIFSSIGLMVLLMLLIIF